MPHMFTTNECVAYTGTHDNDTLQGWLENCSEELLVIVAQYVEGKKLSVEHAKKLVENGKLRREMIKTILASSAVYAVVTMQDLIGTGNEGRMNTPSTTGANWSWRMKKTDLKKADSSDLRFLSNLFSRNEKNN